MQNLLKELIKLLEQDDRLVVEGQLLKNKIVELGLAMDASLIRILLSHEDIRRHFFADIDGVLVFDKIKFQQFVSNKEFLPDSYTAFKNKIGLTADGQHLTDSKEVVLAWPYKDCVLEGGQTKEDAKRNEVFWNETLAPDQIDRLLSPKLLTNFKKYDKDGEHQVTDISHNDNLIIKGNNLLALHTLKKTYFGKVKLIYIDPPFNTGHDSFLYNDSFNHSTWLTFMKNRLEVAKDFLCQDGVIFIHHDDKENSYLRALCDGIFGRDNFLNNIVVKTSDPSGHKTVNPSPYSQTEYILMYAKSKPNYKYEIQYVPSEYDPGYNQYIENLSSEYSEWVIRPLREKVATLNDFKTTNEASKKLGKSAFEQMVADFALKNKESVFQPTAISDDAGGDIVKLRDLSKQNKDVIYCHKREGYEDVYIRNGRQMYFYSSKVKEIDNEITPAKPLTNLWVDIPYNGISGEGGVSLKNGKKPEKLLRRIIDICTEKKDIVMDFHLGSGTTVAVAHKLDRQYIGIEQLEYGDNDSLVRLRNVIEGDQTGVSKAVKWQGGGSFVYCELEQANQKFVGRIQEASDSVALQAIWQEMQNKAFLSYRIDPKTINEAASDFTALSLEDQKRFLIETLDKNMLYVPFSEIDDETYGVSDEDKKLNRLFFSQQ